MGACQGPVRETASDTSGDKKRSLVINAATQFRRCGAYGRDRPGSLKLFVLKSKFPGCPEGAVRHGGPRRSGRLARCFPQHPPVERRCPFCEVQLP